MATTAFPGMVMRRRSTQRHLPAPGPRPQPVAAVGSVTCRGCSRRFIVERYDAQLRVCPHCGHHGVVPAWMRVKFLVDPESMEKVTFADVHNRDPLKFNDGVPYPKRVAEARTKTGLDEAFAVARGTVSDIPVVVAAMDFGFLGGSLGSAAGEIFARACEIAVREKRALIAVCTSGGARMQEGIASLAQMARCSNGVATVSAARLPYISVLTDPCFGGVTASFAVQADVIFAEPKARIGFAGGRVIEQATHDKLPEGFQTAEFLLAHGMIDAVVERKDLRKKVGDVLAALSEPAK